MTLKIEKGMPLVLRRAQLEDETEIKACYVRSAELHQPWCFPPQDYNRYLSSELRYFVCLQGLGDIVGTFNISGVVRGYFQSAYMSYEVFHPYQGMGYMSAGLKLVLKEVFEVLKLHRIEANIQPENSRSIRLVSNAGFVQEGYSKNYLNVGGKGWKDHERWAKINPQWPS